MKLAKEVGKDLRTLPSACRSAAIRLLELGKVRRTGIKTL